MIFDLVKDEQKKCKDRLKTSNNFAHCNSYNNLTKSITELEEEIKKLTIQYQALETKTRNIKVKYAVGGVIAGIVVSIVL